MGTASRWLAVMVVTSAAACGAADNRVDPGDLALRDVLGMAPEVALGWDGAQRAAARAVLADGLEPAGATTAPPLGLAGGRNRDERVARTLATIDRARAADGDDAFGLVRVAIDGTTVHAAARAGLRATGWAAGAAGAAVAPVELWLAPAWDEVPGWAPLPDRGFELLAALAHDAGHVAGPVLVAPSPRLAVISAYVEAAEGPPVLLVNPVLLAAQEPADDEIAAGAAGGSAVSVVRGGGPADAAGARAPGGGPGGDTLAGPISIAGTGGNPYSFYGSVAECAFAQRARCEACLPTSTCAPVTDSPDGNTECTTLAADLGIGYFLLCANLSLSISSVNACVADEAPACPFIVDAASRIALLDVNRRFVDDPVCAMGLDACLADIYGAPDQPFPGPGGGTPPPDPPRNLSLDCGDGCSNDNANCEAGCGNCSADGPSCNNSLSCDSGCSSSNEQSGCGGNCEGCDASDDSGGSSGGGCGGCDSDGGGSGGGDSCSSDSSSGNGSCDSCSSDSGNDSGGSCDSCSSDSSSDSDGCSGGGCGGGSGDGGGCGGGSGDSGGCGGGSGGGGCGGGGGGGGNSCNVARRGPPAGLTLAIAGLWGVLPIPVAGWFLRRARKRRARGEPRPDGGDAPGPDGAAATAAAGGEGGAS